MIPSSPVLFESSRALSTAVVHHVLAQSCPAVFLGATRTGGALVSNRARKASHHLLDLIWYSTSSISRLHCQELVLEITRRADYAIRLLLELARSGDAPVSVRVLAERQRVPPAFARSVQRDLARAGLVHTVRGARGGMVLALPPQDVTLYDVVVAAQGRPSVAVCANDPGWCEFGDACAVHEVWCEADGLVKEFLGTKTLAGLSRA